MAVATSLLVGSLALGGVTGIIGGINAAEAARAQGAFQKQQFDTNARLAELNAKDALKRGVKDVERLKKQGKQLIGEQRVQLAAQGVDLGEGSALEIQMETADFIAQDALTISNNAWREAWGFRVEAANLQFQGQFSELAARNKASTSLLTGGLKGLSAGLKVASLASGLGSSKFTAEGKGFAGGGGRGLIPRRQTQPLRRGP